MSDPYMPILPYIEDTKENIAQIVDKANQYGVKFIVPSFGVTLRDRQRAYYYKELDKKILGLRQKYEKKYKNYYGCYCNNYKVLKQIFYEKCNKYNIDTKMPSYEKENTKEQLSFFK